MNPVSPSVAWRGLRAQAPDVPGSDAQADEAKITDAQITEAQAQSVQAPAPSTSPVVCEPLARAAMQDLRRRADAQGLAARRDTQRERVAHARQVARWAQDRRRMDRALRRVGIPLPVEAWGLSGTSLTGLVHGHWLSVDARGTLRRASGQPVTGAADLMETAQEVGVTPLSGSLLGAVHRADRVLRSAPALGWGALALSLLPPLLLGAAGAGLSVAAPWFVVGLMAWVMSNFIDLDVRGTDLWFSRVVPPLVVGLMSLIIFGETPATLLVALCTGVLHLGAARLLIPDLQPGLVGPRILGPDLDAPEFSGAPRP